MPSPVVTRPASADRRVDDTRALRTRVRKVDFSDLTYQDDDSTTTVTAAQVGLKHIVAAFPHGIAMASDKSVGNAVGVTINAAGTSVAFTLFEAAATGLNLLRKTDNEAVPTGLNVRCTFVGY